MTMGVDPQKLMQVQGTTRFIKAEIRVDISSSRISLTMESENEEARAVIPKLLNQMATALATQLSTYFAIQGEIIDVGPNPQT